MQATACLIVVSALITVASFASVPLSINVPVITKYITTEVQTVDQDETIVLIGQLCVQSKGMAVNVTVLLNNNPGWDPTFGVLRYYVVDAPGKTASSALCTNIVAGVAHPNCFVKAWPSTSNDIYIKGIGTGTAGQSAAISFRLDAEIFSKTGDQAAYIPSHAPVHNADIRVFNRPTVSRDLVYLTEIITLAAVQPLAYHQAALLNFTFCPTPATGSRYEVRATTTGMDGQSSFAQYICDKVPCTVDGPNVIAHNGCRQSCNVVTTCSGQWKTLYALIVCWGGIFDPAKDQYICHFMFFADQL